MHARVLRLASLVCLSATAYAALAVTLVSTYDCNNVVGVILLVCTVIVCVASAFVVAHLPRERTQVIVDLDEYALRV